MLFCRHRVNDPNALSALPTSFGVEIDLRSDRGELHLEHDPFAPGPRFEDWLDHYRHAFIVLNIKEEGLEERVGAMLAERGVEEWAFLDQSFPFLVRSLRSGERRTMVRVSEFESARTALALDPRPRWVWVDSFTGGWPDPEDLATLAGAGYRFMVVSPELQGRTPESEIATIGRAFGQAGVAIDGVCSKRPDLWV